MQGGRKEKRKSPVNPQREREGKKNKIVCMYKYIRMMYSWHDGGRVEMLLSVRFCFVSMYHSISIWVIERKQPRELE